MHKDCVFMQNISKLYYHVIKILQNLTMNILYFSLNDKNHFAFYHIKAALKYSAKMK